MSKMFVETKYSLKGGISMPKITRYPVGKEFIVRKSFNLLQEGDVVRITQTKSRAKVPGKWVVEVISLTTGVQQIIPITRLRKRK